MFDKCNIAPHVGYQNKYGTKARDISYGEIGRKILKKRLGRGRGVGRGIGGGRRCCTISSIGPEPLVQF